jgi:molybdate transport system regulatory protein
MSATPDDTQPAAPGLDRARATRILLLAAVRDTGSISKAARQAGLSYKGAWNILDSMNRQSRTPLFERVSGGAGGGGTRLTAHGLALLSAGEMVQRLADTLGRALDTGERCPLLARLGLQTSARNQFSGHITAIRTGAVNDIITLAMPVGGDLQITVTRDSSRAMHLRVGDEVLALFKAGAVVLADAGAARIAAVANRLTGRITRIETGAVNTEVELSLPGGAIVCAMSERAGFEHTGLTMGDSACALVNPADIILATLA